jgi:type I restriction enzyme M protein
MPRATSTNEVVFLNPRTCGIYKNGQPRYKTDPRTGRRTNEIDNELIEAVNAYLAGEDSSGEASIAVPEVYEKKVLVPTYYDDRYNEGIANLLADLDVESVTLGELLDEGALSVRGGHGSPSNDQRQGHIPYVKVSDIRGLRINVNPTNLVTDVVARRHWRGATSGLRAWDVITPNRASSNIGEFAILLPGEEEVVLTKEVFVFRVREDDELWDPFYLLWALSLRTVRDQWRRIALMQTNREDCGDRYREIVVPKPPSRKWAEKAAGAFAAYFRSVAAARDEFIDAIADDGVEYVANVRAVAVVDAASEVGEEPDAPADATTTEADAAESGI